MDLCGTLRRHRGGAVIPLLGGKLVTAIELDPGTLRAYAHLHKSCCRSRCGNVCSPAEWHILQGIHLQIAGFPCQPYSGAGPQKGFSDPRAAPLAAIINIAAFLRPLVLLLENVIGFYSHKGTIREW